MAEGFYLVAVHGGAGNHSHAKPAEKELKKALVSACTRALESLQHGDTSLDAVEKAISVLEDEECLNAGYGSNLTLKGTVECDASVIDGQTCDFGSVGAVSGVKNPVKLARAVLEHSRIPDPMGRIPPMTLVSDGALQFSISKGHDLVPIDSLISSRATQEWTKWKTMLDSPLMASRKGTDTEFLKGAFASEDNMHDRQDTVGAAAWDADGRLSAGVSSGGILLKHPGRIGEAAVFGAGCWATQALDGSSRGIACSISGTGEAIIRASLAKAIGNAFSAPVNDYDDPHDLLQRVLVEDFYKTCRDRGQLEPNAGLILILRDKDDAGCAVARLWCAFTTESMAVAYASSLDPKPKAFILRRPQRRRADTVPIYICALPLTTV